MNNTGFELDRLQAEGYHGVSQAHESVDCGVGFVIRTKRWTIPLSDYGRRKSWVFETKADVLKFVANG